MFSKGRLRQFSMNQSISRVIQHATFIIYLPALFKTHFFSFLDNHFNRTAIYPRISDAQSKSVQSRLGLEAMDQLVEIVGQYPYCTTKYFAYFINY